MMVLNAMENTAIGNLKNMQALDFHILSKERFVHIKEKN